MAIIWKTGICLYLRLGGNCFPSTLCTSICCCICIFSCMVHCICNLNTIIIHPQSDYSNSSQNSVIQDSFCQFGIRSLSFSVFLGDSYLRCLDYMTLGSTWFGFKVIVVYVVTELDSSLMESETTAPPEDIICSRISLVMALVNGFVCF